ncbi:MAG: heme exporter protein CcmD [Magnetococcales bacterium]|nr:heme exporter protein CcmD [Magnetococcales bacterium]
MNEYADYVWSVYLLAGTLFGGLALMWWRSLRRLQQRQRLQATKEKQAP